MQGILDKIALNKALLNEDEIYKYFYTMQGTLRPKDDIWFNEQYDLEIVYCDDDDDVVFNKDNNTFTLNLAKVIESSCLPFEYLTDVEKSMNIQSINLKILETVNKILSEIYLNTEIAKGNIAKMSPEFYVCAINEDYQGKYIKPVRDNFLNILSMHYTSEILKNCENKEGFEYIDKNMYDLEINSYIKERFLSKRRYYPLEIGIVKDSTPESLFDTGIDYDKLEEFVTSKYGKRAWNMYKDATDSFINRGYLRKSNTIYSYMHCNYIYDLSDINNNLLFNKLLFGERLSEDEKEQLYQTTYPNMLDYALDNSYYQNYTTIKSIAR